MRPPVASVEALADQGVWLVSPAGMSFVCRCNWRSGIKPTDAEVSAALVEHYEEKHAS
jgi:hypothetical protein